MVFRSTVTPLTRVKVVRGKHAADKCDDDQGVFSVVADRVEVPPTVTIPGNGRVEGRRPVLLLRVGEHDPVGVPPEVQPPNVSRAQPALENAAHRGIGLQAGKNANVASRFVFPRIRASNISHRVRRELFDEYDALEVHGGVGQHDGPQMASRLDPQPTNAAKIC